MSIDRRAIRDHVALKIPLAPQLVIEQKLVDAGGLPVDAVVGAHHGAGLALGYRRAERRQVGVHFVVLAHFHVGNVPRRLGSAVHREMLRRRNGEIVFRIVSLHAGDEGDAHARRQEWIFAVGLLAASPARVAKDVDVWRPEVQAFEDAAVPFAHRLDVLDSSFDPDGLGHAVNGLRIKGCGQADRLGKLGGAAAITPCSASLHQS